MGRRKVNKNVMVSIILAVILFLVTGGYLLWKQAERMANRMLEAETVCDEYVENVFASLSVGDMEHIYSLFPEGHDRTQIAKGLAELDEIWAGRQTYDYEKTGIQTKFTNGSKTVTCTYLITSGEERFALQVRRGEYPDGSSALVAFVMTPAVVETAASGENGQVLTGVQWVLRICSILVMAATLVTVVFCIRHQTEKKWLWVAGILLMYGVVSLSWGAGGVKFGIAVRTPGFSKLVFAGNSSFSLYLPLGMILFWHFYGKNKKRDKAMTGM